MKATEQYFPVVLFIMLYKEVLTFESVDESLSFTIQMNGTEQVFPREVQKALTSDSRCLFSDFKFSSSSILQWYLLFTYSLISKHRVKFHLTQERKPRMNPSVDWNSVC